MIEFQDKIVLAVGGAGYLCSPACALLAARGATVVATDLDEAKAQNFARELNEQFPGRALGLRCDVGDETSIKDVVRQAMEKFGRLDVLINAAYQGSHGQNLEEMPPDAFERAARVQLSGSFLLARECAAVMSSGASMVFFSSMYGRVSPPPEIYQAPMKPNPIDYGVVKAGLEQMIRYLAVHYAPRNIRVNCVVPGAFPNAATNEPLGFAEFTQRLASKTPMQRIGRQEEMAGPVAFLASDDASFVTGHCLVVDGGWTIW